MSLWKNTTGKELNFNVGKRFFEVKPDECVRLDAKDDYVIPAKKLPLVKVEDVGKGKVVEAKAPPKSALMPGVSSGPRTHDADEDEGDSEEDDVSAQLAAQGAPRGRKS